MKSAKEGFQLSENFNLQVEFGTIISSPYLGDIPTSELDKSYDVSLEFSKLRLRFKEDIYTYFMRTVDLNLAWIDEKEKEYNFRNEEEYFRSTDQLLKSKMIMKAEVFSITYFMGDEMLGELFFGSPIIEHEYFLNFKQIYQFKVPHAQMLYIKNHKKNLLIGPSLAKHQLSLGEDPERPEFEQEAPMGEIYKNAIGEVDEEETEDNNMDSDEKEYQEPEEHGDEEPEFHLFVTIDCDPSGAKDYFMKLSKLKFFANPYHFFMVQHFFSDYLPLYEGESFDKPNEYDADPDSWPRMHLKVDIEKSLLCMSDENNKAVACTCTAQFQYQRERIRDSKTVLIQKIYS